jgi:hypothetical protein
MNNATNIAVLYLSGFWVIAKSLYSSLFTKISSPISMNNAAKAVSSFFIINSLDHVTFKKFNVHLLNVFFLKQAFIAKCVLNFYLL